jgi:hypothetical protein
LCHGISTALETKHRIKLEKLEDCMKILKIENDKLREELEEIKSINQK